MADEKHTEAASTSEATGENSESNVELNIKTLDSRMYTFRVDKNMPVPLFKEKIANAVGVPVGQQRLIFRGKVLKDDHLLSEYQVENGHTLHLVARQPVQSQPSSGTSIGEASGNNDNRANDSTAGAPRNRVGQVSRSVVLGTFNVGEQGEGVVPDLTQIIGAVLSSFGIGGQPIAGGINSISPTVPSNVSGQASQGIEIEGMRNDVGSRSQAGNQVQPVQAFPNHPFQALPQALQFPLTGAAIPVPSLHMPMPDSLNTLSGFINHMELTLSLNGSQPNPSPVSVGDPPRLDLPSNARGQPTPEALSIILRQAQQLLSGHTVAALSHIAGRLEGEGASTDPSVRNQIQTESMQVGLAMQHLGALFLELGRTILTLRMGHSSAESLVNAGPAVYISPSGPNPIMVQPFPLQTSSLFGSASAATQANPGVVGPIRLGDAPRHINIHIHAGTSPTPAVSSVGSTTNTGEGAQGERSNGTGSGDSAPARALPARNVIAAAVSSRSAAEAASHVRSDLYPHHMISQPTNPILSAPIQGSGVAVSSTAQPSMGVSVLQPTSGSVSLSTAISEVSSQLRNLVDDMRVEHLAPSAQLEASTDQDSSMGNHQHNSMAVNGAGETSVSLPDCMSEREGQQSQPECHQYGNDEESNVNLSSKEAATNYSVGGSLSCPTEETILPHKSEFASEDAPRSSQRHDLPEGSKAIPMGLGLGGLQPKRRSRQVKSQGKDSDGTSSALPVNQNKQTIASGQQVLQSLASRGSVVNRTDANGLPSGQLPHVLGQIMERMSLGGQGSDGQFEAASMMSHVINSPALNSLLAGVSEQTGVGSPAVLRNVLEQVTQSPLMTNTLNQIAQQIEGQDLGNIFSGLGGGQGGGLDLSRMVQQMMPIVSQALSRGSVNPEPFHGVEPHTQPQCNEKRPGTDNKLDYQNSQIDLQQTAQRIECHDPPRDIFRTMVENAARLYDHGNDSEDLVEQLCSNEDLANEFMEMLHRDIRRRFQGDSGSTDKS